MSFFTFHWESSLTFIYPTGLDGENDGVEESSLCFLEFVLMAGGGVDREKKSHRFFHLSKRGF